MHQRSLKTLPQFRGSHFKLRYKQTNKKKKYLAGECKHMQAQIQIVSKTGRGLERVVVLMKSLSGKRGDPALQSKRFEPSTNKSVCLDSVQISAASRRQTGRELLLPLLLLLEVTPPRATSRDDAPPPPARGYGDSSGAFMTTPVLVTRAVCDHVGNVSSVRPDQLNTAKLLQRHLLLSSHVEAAELNRKHLLRYPKISSIFMFILYFF